MWKIFENTKAAALIRMVNIQPNKCFHPLQRLPNRINKNHWLDTEAGMAGKKKSESGGKDFLLACLVCGWKSLSAILPFAEGQDR
ncbi:hypothetical protein [Methylacidiphilum caldifontis]|uniref:Uncharacterized protein n=1 Tax=Methylacidiphilum caldifontis TaxID=2795386 RepID=A0A4Y8PDH9_9BACT|nr:hypothetical protein [Methylacidiphilum caldifontis]TFE69563.1 hypothetical protein A7Q10_06845 [Methylacidiphilum caldifontis]